MGANEQSLTSFAHARFQEEHLHNIGVLKATFNNTCPSVSVITLFKVKLIIWDTEKFHYSCRLITTMTN